MGPERHPKRPALTLDEIQAEVDAQISRARRRVQESQELVQITAEHCSSSLPKIRSGQEIRRRQMRAR